MIRRSLSWKPVIAYGFVAAVFASGATAAVVGVFLVRNPATAVWALAAAPLYFLVFFLTTAIPVAIVVAILAPPAKMPKVWRQITVVLVSGLAGVGVAFEFWWCIDFESPPLWALAVGFLSTGVTFLWYFRRYERHANSALHADGAFSVRF